LLLCNGVQEKETVKLALRCIYLPNNPQIDRKHFSRSPLETATPTQLLHTLKQAFPWSNSVIEDWLSAIDDTCFPPRISRMKEPLPNRSRDITLDIFRFRQHLIENNNDYMCSRTNFEVFACC
jgi:hypothetical protein